jgi:hypothetical protein
MYKLFEIQKNKVRARKKKRDSLKMKKKKKKKKWIESESGHITRYRIDSQPGPQRN